MKLRVLFVSGALVSGSLVACSSPSFNIQLPDASFDAALPDGGGGEGGALGQGVGQPCDAVLTCRPGLACNAGKCAPAHASGDGTPCTISAECKDGLYCGPARTCTAAGAGADGAACKSDADCKSGLRCAPSGFSLKCTPEGDKDVGGACVTSSDCFAGLACVNKACTPLPPNPGGPPLLGLPTWKGAECKDDPGPTQAYFRVPRGSNDGDFYRLPFPNDVRLKSGRPDMSGHPSPGPEILGFDIVDRYLRDVEKSADGWSAYGTVFFRFSKSIDFDSLKLAGSMRFVDVTTTTGGDLNFYWEADTGRDAYLCENSLKIRPSLGRPLEPGHTYAVLLTTQIVDTTKTAIARPADLVALLGGAPPADATLSAAYTSYAPLRAWMAANTVNAANVLDATMFTVAKSRRVASKMRAAVMAAAAPTASGWIKCGAAPSPCSQATGDRACGAAVAEFDELHALVKMPIFQKGTAPYLTPADGGEIETTADGTPVLQRTEDVCMALTVPKGVAMPAGGWPLVVYAHGTGGSFRSHILDGTAARLARAPDGAGGSFGVAVLGIDQVSHGPRRGASTASPDDLFFNIVNPSAARGNPLQGAADQASLVRFAKSLNLLAASSPTGADIRVGTVGYWGHSQGATEGGIVMPYLPSTDVAGVVFSGQGASLMDALRTKTSPVDIASAVPFVLVDPDAKSEFHPVLPILELAIESADPLVHAAVLFSAPGAPTDAKHVFQPYGTGDTYAPERTQKIFALAAGLAPATPPSGFTGDPISAAQPLTLPASGNITIGGRPLTAIVRQYNPSGYDGHFVSQRQPNAKKDVDQFLGDALTGKAPRIGLP